MDKAQVLEKMQTERADFEELLAPLSEEQLCQNTLEDGRSIKDILAHLAAWERRCAGWIATGLRGEMPERPEPGATWEDIDRINERTFQENRERSLQDVQQDSRQAYQQLLEQVQALSEEDITNPNRFVWTEGELLTWYIASNSYEHYLEHTEQIRVWLAGETLQA